MRDSPYLSLVRRRPALLGFGFLMAFGSSAGQTFFVGVFGPAIQATYNLSHTGWGTVYLVATLGSAAILPVTGKLIDRMPLAAYATAALALLAAACAAMALSFGIASLVIAILLLRHAGQGLASHTAVTAMARYFSADRGRAIAIATLGFSAGEALLPVTAVAAITAFGWRLSYAGIALAVALIAIPIARLLLARSRLTAVDTAPSASDENARSWTRGEVLRDPRFYLLLPGVVAPALIITALFFHNLNIADAKGWSHGWIAGNYVVFAGSGMAVSLVIGPIVDRVGATRLVPLMLLPLIAGLVALAALDHRLAVWPYLALCGFGIGVAHTSVTPMWAELYGVGHIGAVRAMVSALAVFASALGPVALGALIDAGVSVERAVLIFAAYAGLASLLMIAALARRGPS